MSKLTPAEKTAAIRRVQADGPEAVDTLTALAGVSRETLVDWIISGRSGAHLDGLQRAGKWFSSAAAVTRFQTARKAKRKKHV